MKDILFIMTDLNGGGAEKSLIKLLESIDYTQYRVSLCLLFHKGVYLQDIPREVRVISLFNDRLSLLYYLQFIFYRICKSSCFLSFMAYLKIRDTYDVIISFMEGHPLLLHSLITKKGKINISWIHCDLYNYHYTKHIFLKPDSELNSYKKMDKLVFVSQKSMKHFEDLYQINIPKYYIYNIVDTNEIRKLAIMQTNPKHLFTITSIGSLIPIKGFERLISMARRLKDDGYSFCIQVIGEGLQKKELIELRNKLQLEDDILFLGFQKSPYTYLQQSDIFVSTSISEGLPYVICEALTLGVPVIATKTVGAIELLGDNEFGIVTEHDDRSIYLEVKSLMDNPELRSRYACKGEERMEYFKREKIMPEFYSLIGD